MNGQSVMIYERWVGVALSLVALVQPAAGQGAPKDMTTYAYGGSISWNNTSTGPGGNARETVVALVTAGQVQCSGSWVSPERSTPISGPGLLKIDMGITPNADTLAPSDFSTAAEYRQYRDSVDRAPRPSGKMYTIRVACPNAQYNPTRIANYSASMFTFQQPGGDLGQDSRTKAIILPDTLKGSWSEYYPNVDGPGGSTTTLTWLLCVGCKPPAASPP